MDCPQIRQEFVRYYQSQGFQSVPPASMLTPSKPMSYVFSCNPPDPPETTETSENKFVKIQSCFRHFDMNTVGMDNQHLSLFEMSGAFHFGNNLHENTIKNVWQFIEDVLKINSDRIWITYFGGGEFDNHQLSADKQSYQAWLNVGVSDNKLVALGIDHNYWIEDRNNKEKTIRKCGHHTELFYDSGAKACGINCQPGCSCGRFIEFVNIRFITSFLKSDINTIESLDIPFAETVMGIERVAMILQNASSVFDTSSYANVINIIHGFVRNTNLRHQLVKQSEYLIADHLRALCVLIADGAPEPGRGGRKRIIKLLIRKVLTCQMMLGISSPYFLSTVITALIKTEGKSLYAELKIKEKIKAYFEVESRRFGKKIDHNNLLKDYFYAG